MYDFTKYVSRDERRTITRLLSYATQQKWSVSVNDGGEWVASKIRPSAATRYLGTTSEDWVKFHNEAGNTVGVAWLVYGNSGEEVIADLSANEAMEKAWNYSMEIWND